MALNYEPFSVYEGTLDTTLTTVLYTVPAATRVLVTSVLAANQNTTTARSVTLKGGTTPTTWLPAVGVAAKTAFPFAPHQILEPGDTIQGGQDAGTDVAVSISGVKITGF